MKLELDVKKKKLELLIRFKVYFIFATKYNIIFS